MDFRAHRSSGEHRKEKKKTTNPSRTEEEELITKMVDRNVFVTVGTTRFEMLISLATSQIGIDWMVSQGFTSLTIQYGTGQKPKIADSDKGNSSSSKLKIKCYDFQPSLDEDMKNADLIISHAGAGTVMESLRLKKKLIVVINTQLMDNHQMELADAMANRGHLFVVDEPSKLQDSKTWQQFEGFAPIVFEGGDEMALPRLLDSFFGFSLPASSSSKND